MPKKVPTLSGGSKALDKEIWGGVGGRLSKEFFAVNATNLDIAKRINEEVRRARKNTLLLAGRMVKLEFDSDGSPLEPWDSHDFREAARRIKVKIKLTKKKNKDDGGLD